MPSFSLDRRQALMLMSSTALLPLVRPAFAQENAPIRLIILSDLHSAYEVSAQLLAAVAAEVEASQGPVAILINGDVFELGNVVAVRSGGVIDWALLEALGRLAPTVLNIGNHEPDLDNDLAHFISKAEQRGVTVISNILDSRTGEAYAPAALSLTLGGMQISIVGLGTAAINTYPAATREMIEVPDPVQWAGEHLINLLDPSGARVVLSHAGITADRDMLPLLPAGTLLVGGHDHVVLDHSEGATRYLHTGSWSSLMTVVDIDASGPLAVERRPIAATGQADADLAALIASTMEEHLTAEERAVIGSSQAAQSLADSARFVAATLASAAGADIGFIGHTTFGTGFPEGEVTRYAFDSIVRFDGTLKTAEISRETLEEILGRVNQDGDIPLARRTGDFLYGAPTDLPEKDTYLIAANDWSATNQKNYFGREDLVFVDVPDLRVKSVVIDAL
ncbi:metallophosphoesterase [Pelagibacterium sp. 26DY04]|uniref:metallophosphoesterase n=1 Tax=Pelagibacterium sp. 26DY04 TaxID=2967130 RepID=UPI0028155904|nr:metallophosphoesterase [Pelagibacterium sp. 26DY04]WMT85763.1 metallophosphoesterase [Pelagibacterium sp. 26DY04]